MKTLVLILAVFVSACSSRVIPVQVALPPCPHAPELVKMTDDQFNAFTVFRDAHEGAVKVINKREDQLQAHIKTLCGIIESTHGESQ